MSAIVSVLKSESTGTLFCHVESGFVVGLSLFRCLVSVFVFLRFGELYEESALSTAVLWRRK